MLEGAKAADERESRKGKTEGASSKKISIRHLGRGFYFTAGRGLSSPGSDLVPAPALYIPLRELVSARRPASAVEAPDGDGEDGGEGHPGQVRHQQPRRERPDAAEGEDGGQDGDPEGGELQRRQGRAA